MQVPLPGRLHLDEAFYVVLTVLYTTYAYRHDYDYACAMFEANGKPWSWKPCSSVGESPECGPWNGGYGMESIGIPSSSDHV